MMILHLSSCGRLPNFLALTFENFSYTRNQLSPSFFNILTTSPLVYINRLQSFTRSRPQLNLHSQNMGLQEVAQSRVVHLPCAACRMLRRKCETSCLLAPYFPGDEVEKFAGVHKVFGASNVIKMIQVRNRGA